MTGGGEKQKEEVEVDDGVDYTTTTGTVPIRGLRVVGVALDLSNETARSNLRPSQ